MQVNENDSREFVDWFALTEKVSDILNALMAHYFREAFKEGEKEEPDKEKIKLYKSKFHELKTLYYEAATFEDLETIKAVIAKYSPVLREIYVRI